MLPQKVNQQKREHLVMLICRKMVKAAEIKNKSQCD